MADRENLHAKLSAEAKDALVAWCYENGVTVTALLEAIGRHAGTDGRHLAAFVDEARQISREANSRRPSRG